MALSEQDIEKLKSVLAAKENFESLTTKVDAGFKDLKNNFAVIHSDLIKHDEAPSE